MISTLVGTEILRNVTRRVPEFLSRSKCTTAYNQQALWIKSDMGDTELQDMKNPYEKEKRVCILCQHKLEPDYKNVRLLSQFQSQHTGQIYGKHITGLCDYKQKRVEEEICKARSAGLMGYMTKEPKYVNDPKLFDPNFPFKPHPY